MDRKPIHPGTVLKEEVMIPLGLSVTETAKQLGISRKQLSLFINEKASLSPEMAIRISEVTGTSAELWMRLQIKLSIWKTSQRKRTASGPTPLPLNSKIARTLLEKLEDMHDIKVADEAYAGYKADSKTISMEEMKKKYDIEDSESGTIFIEAHKGLVDIIKEGEKEDISKMKVYNPDEDF